MFICKTAFKAEGHGFTPDEQIRIALVLPNKDWTRSI